MTKPMTMLAAIAAAVLLTGAAYAAHPSERDSRDPLSHVSAAATQAAAAHAPIVLQLDHSGPVAEASLLEVRPLREVAELDLGAALILSEEARAEPATHASTDLAEAMDRYLDLTATAIRPAPPARRKLE